MDAFSQKKANVLVRFAQVFDRLDDTLLVLDVRADSIMNVLDQKWRHKEQAYYVPRLDILPYLQVLTAAGQPCTRYESSARGSSSCARRVYPWVSHTRTRVLY